MQVFASVDQLYVVHIMKHAVCTGLCIMCNIHNDAQCVQGFLNMYDQQGKCGALQARTHDASWHSVHDNSDEEHQYNQGTGGTCAVHNDTSLQASTHNKHHSIAQQSGSNTPHLCPP